MLEAGTHLMVVVTEDHPSFGATWLDCYDAQCRDNPKGTTPCVEFGG